MSVNKVILIGRLGRDPESRTTQSGTTLATMSLATERKWTNPGGEAQKETEWHRIVAWGKIADVCVKYLVKGREVYIEGALRTRQYDDKGGEKRSVTEVVALEVKFLGDGKARSDHAVTADAEVGGDVPF